MSFSLKKSLMENHSIRLKEVAKDWKEAIQVTVAPLVESGAVEKAYANAIIASTEEFGPYYILVPGIAMPHAKPGEHIKKDSFSLITLKEPVKFPDESEVDVLLCLAATSGDAHTRIAIPQIIALLQLDNIRERLQNAENLDDVVMLLEEAEHAQLTE